MNDGSVDARPLVRVRLYAKPHVWGALLISTFIGPQSLLAGLAVPFIGETAEGDPPMLLRAAVGAVCVVVGGFMSWDALKGWGVVPIATVLVGATTARVTRPVWRTRAAAEAPRLGASLVEERREFQLVSRFAYELVQPGGATAFRSVEPLSQDSIERLTRAWPELRVIEHDGHVAHRGTGLAGMVADATGTATGVGSNVHVHGDPNAAHVEWNLFEHTGDEFERVEFTVAQGEAREFEVPSRNGVLMFIALGDPAANGGRERRLTPDEGVERIYSVDTGTEHAEVSVGFTRPTGAEHVDTVGYPGLVDSIVFLDEVVGDPARILFETPVRAVHVFRGRDARRRVMLWADTAPHPDHEEPQVRVPNSEA